MSTQPGQALAQLRCQFTAALGAIQRHSQGLDLIGQLLEAGRLCCVGGDVEVTQLFALGSCNATRPEQQQVGLQAEQALHVQLAVTAHRGHIAQLWQRFPGLQAPHQQIGGTQLYNHFGQGR